MPMSPGEMIAAQGAQGAQQDQPEGGWTATPQGNPIIDAFRTMMTFVAAKQEQGDPNAPEMQEIMRRFVELIQGRGADQSQMAPPAPNGGPPTSGGGRVPLQGGGMNQMTGNMSAGARSQAGKIPVI
jgi:hypothetical protein